MTQPTLFAETQPDAGLFERDHLGTLPERPRCQAGRYVKRHHAKFSTWEQCVALAVREGYCATHYVHHLRLERERKRHGSNSDHTSNDPLHR